MSTAHALAPGSKTLPTWVADLFASIDAKDTAAFVAFLTDDCTLQFGNAPLVNGKAAIYATISGFFSAIKSLRHHDLEAWVTPDATICSGTVTYTRHDDTTLSVPFANILRGDGTLIHHYAIYINDSALFG